MLLLDPYFFRVLSCAWTKCNPSIYSGGLYTNMNFLRDWPEPIVRVQSISESGVRTIPQRYIKPPSERPSAATDGCGDDAAAAAAAGSRLSIPVIDLSALTDGACGGTAVKAITEACMNWGFFQVVNHGVSPELMKGAREAWREFFHLPVEEKQLYANSPKTYEGYGSRLGIEKGAILDWGDYYFLHFLPSCLKSHDKWPALPNHLRGTTEKYGEALVKLCRGVMKALSFGLGLDVDRLPAAFGGDDVGVCMRVNYYPKCPQPDLTLGLSAHSDPGGMTVLLVDDCVKGLQVRKDGAWVTVDPVTDAFIVNVGDQIQVLSNSTYKSVEHRVMVNAATERLSMAFFFNPRSDIPIGPMPELVTDEHPALYQPMTFDEYRLYIRKKGPRGKSQVESLWILCAMERSLSID